MEEDKNLEEKNSQSQETAAQETTSQETASQAAQPPHAEKSEGSTRSPQSGFGKGVLAGIGICVGVLFIGALIFFIVMVRNNRLVLRSMTSDPAASERVDNSARIDMDTVEEKLDILQDIVAEEYLFDQDIEASEEGIYKGYIDGLGDEYSEYFTAEEFEALTADMQGVFYGIGATVQQDPDTKVVTVVQVIKDSPAEKAGVKNGDIIYSVGDVIATETPFDTLVYDTIRGEKGTDVTITFIRDGEKLDITITRGEVPEVTVYSEITDDGIGYIEVSQFTDETVAQFTSAIDEMEDKEVEGLVIDLRNNVGGVLDGAVQMADYILPDGVEEHEGLIVYTANKDGVGERYYATDAHEVDMPIVLLVNEYSASASEVFTGAMMDYEKAQVVGTQTFGKGIVQTVQPLGDGSAVKLTVEHYYTPDGTDLHGKGLTPDYEVELDDECTLYMDEHDNQFAKAKELLLAK